MEALIFQSFERKIYLFIFSNAHMYKYYTHSRMYTYICDKKKKTSTRAVPGESSENISFVFILY